VGKYKDVNGKEKAVAGDMTKIRYVTGLSEAAQKLLRSIEHTSRKIAGTQETRRIMRFDTKAHCVRYGVPIFVTFSPDESNNLLMIRLSRTRRNDSVFAEKCDGQGKVFAARVLPKCQVDTDVDVFYQSKRCKTRFRIIMSDGNC
jgi:hypothetical protein